MHIAELTGTDTIIQKICKMQYDHKSNCDFGNLDIIVIWLKKSKFRNSSLNFSMHFTDRPSK